MCARGWVHVCACVRGCECPGLCSRACSLTYSACNAHASLSAASLAPLHFFTLSYKRHDFREKVTGHKICVLIFSTNFM